MGESSPQASGLRHKSKLSPQEDTYLYLTSIAEIITVKKSHFSEITPWL